MNEWFDVNKVMPEEFITPFSEGATSDTCLMAVKIDGKNKTIFFTTMGYTFNGEWYEGTVSDVPYPEDRPLNNDPGYTVVAWMPKPDFSENDLV